MLRATQNARERWDIHILHIWVRNANDNQIVQNAFRDNEIQVLYTFEITETTNYYKSKCNNYMCNIFRKPYSGY